MSARRGCCSIALARMDLLECPLYGRSTGVTTIQGFFTYGLDVISVWTAVSVRYRAGVRNSRVSVRRGDGARIYGAKNRIVMFN